jgi:Raf kinase inhibitor-like YbhB/YbcL family protein
MARHAKSTMALAAFVAGCTAALLSGPATPDAAAQAALSVKVDALKPGGVILGVYAYCIPARQGHQAPGPNRSPAISWSPGPARTGSYAIVIVDTDVPTDFTNARKEGLTIPADMKRRDFYHWALVDIAPTVTALPEGADSTSFIAEGKPVGPTKYGLRGVNGYGGGIHGGYDGPCPPWNDTIPHHYHFWVYALDVPHLGVSGNFTGPDALNAMDGHVLAKGAIVGVYSMNPDVARTLGR